MESPGFWYSKRGKVRREGEMVSLDSWDSNSGKVRREGEMVSPDSWDSISTKVIRKVMVSSNYWYSISGKVRSGKGKWSPQAPGIPEPVLLNVYGAPELIPRNEFRQPM